MRGDFLWIGVQRIQFGSDGFSGRQYGIRGASLGHQLTPHLSRRQSGIQAAGAQLRVGLALVIDGGVQLRQEVGDMRFRPRNAKAARQRTPVASSNIPLRMIIRPHCSLRVARWSPPKPSSLTVRTINKQQALPLRGLGVSISSVLSESIPWVCFQPENA